MRLLLVILLASIQTITFADTLTGRVHVTDGDTIMALEGSNAQHKIRLQGIDAPERGQLYGMKSKEYLSESVPGKFVVMQYEKLGRYERILGKASELSCCTP